MDPLDLLERSIAVTGERIAAVKSDQYGDPTPCAQWTVRDVANHIIGTSRFMSSLLAGEAVDLTSSTPALAAGDIVAAFNDASRTALAAWRKPGALERTLQFPFGAAPAVVGANIHFVDVLVHGWDIAKATGQDETLDPELATAAYGFVSQALTPALRGTGPDASFGPEVPCAPTAPIEQRLVSFLGRKPQA